MITSERWLCLNLRFASHMCRRVSNYSTPYTKYVAVSMYQGIGRRHAEEGIWTVSIFACAFTSSERTTERLCFAFAQLVSVYSGQKTAKMKTRPPRSSTGSKVVAKPMLDMSAPPSEEILAAVEGTQWRMAVLAEGMLRHMLLRRTHNIVSFMCISRYSRCCLGCCCDERTKVER
jgi:hypothetical protein